MLRAGIPRLEALSQPGAAVGPKWVRTLLLLLTLHHPKSCVSRGGSLAAAVLSS